MECLTTLGSLFQTHIQFKSTSPFLTFFKEVKEQMFALHRECYRGWWLTLALALFTIWPSLIPCSPNWLPQPWRFCPKPALKCFTTALDHIQVCWSQCDTLQLLVQLQIFYKLIKDQHNPQISDSKIISDMWGRKQHWFLWRSAHWILGFMNRI